MSNIKIKGDYKKLRVGSYPEVGDQLDEIWHAINILANEYNIKDRRLDQYVTKIKKVKEKWKK